MLEDSIDCSVSVLFKARERKSERNHREARGGRSGEASEASQTKVHTPSPTSFSFFAGVQFSRDSIRAFNDRIKFRENRWL